MAGLSLKTRQERLLTATACCLAHVLAIQQVLTREKALRLCRHSITRSVTGPSGRRTANPGSTNPGTYKVELPCDTWQVKETQDKTL